MDTYLYTKMNTTNKYFVKRLANLQIALNKAKVNDEDIRSIIYGLSSPIPSIRTIYACAVMDVLKNKSIRKRYDSMNTSNVRTLANWVQYCAVLLNHVLSIII